MRRDAVIPVTLDALRVPISTLKPFHKNARRGNVNVIAESLRVNGQYLPDSSCWLVWDKENGTTSFADAELAWTNHGGAVRMFRHMWNGAGRASELGRRFHPTQKPVALAVWAFDIVDPGARVVLDTFGGSGSTLLGAEQSGRSACLIEMEPVYVDTICRRYQAHTGRMPQLEATGAPQDFLGAADAGRQPVAG